MLVAVSVLAIVAVFVAVSLHIQLSMMRLRAAYWENVVKQDSLIEYQWLQEDAPSWRLFERR
jgi:hypothetical protein